MYDVTHLTRYDARATLADLDGLPQRSPEQDALRRALAAFLAAHR